MSISSKVIETIKAAKQPISCKDIAEKTRQDIFMVKASAKALREEGKIRLVSQGGHCCRGVFSGGDLYQTEQYYEAPK